MQWARWTDRQILAKVNVWNPCPPHCHHPGQGIIIGLLPQPAPGVSASTLAQCTSVQPTFRFTSRKMFPVPIWSTHYPVLNSLTASQCLEEEKVCFTRSLWVPASPSSLASFWAIQDSVFFRLPAALSFLPGCLFPPPPLLILRVSGETAPPGSLPNLFSRVGYFSPLNTLMGYLPIYFLRYHTGDYFFHICLSSVS